MIGRVFNWFLFLSLIVLFAHSSCKKRKSKAIEKKLFGKWEAVYSIRGDDTVFYEEGSTFNCAYAVVNLDYSSGFELRDNFKGDLIWCGINKDQELEWSYRSSNSELTVKEVETGDEDKVIVLDLTHSTMEVLSENIRYYMQKY